MNAPSHPIIDSLMRRMDGLAHDARTATGPRAARNTETWPCTPKQRLYLRVLMQDCDLDTGRVTVAHRRYFRDAGIAQPIPDQRIDSVLAKLTVAEAKALTRVLKKESPHESAL